MATDRIPFFSVVDRNKDGVIDLEEFERCWTGLRLSDTCKLKPDEAFKILDKDNNSHLDIKEFQKFVETMQVILLAVFGFHLTASRKNVFLQK